MDHYNLLPEYQDEIALIENERTDDPKALIYAYQKSRRLILHLDLSNEIYEGNPLSEGKLIDLGSDNPKSRGWTALDTASYRGDLYMINFLIDNGAEINSEDDSVLDFAYSHRKWDAVYLLLKRGANPCLPKYNSPFERAVKLGWKEMVKKMVFHGADINVSIEHRYKSITDVAYTYQEWEICWFLLHCGGKMKRPPKMENRGYYGFWWTTRYDENYERCERIHCNVCTRFERPPYR